MSGPTLQLHRQQLATPLGAMLAIASDRGLCALEFDTGRRHARLEARLQRWFPPHDIVDVDSPFFARPREWLAAYFDGNAMDAPALDLRGAPFELRVWAALQQIPFGETTSYGAIATGIGAPGAARAVGAANGANPVSLIVPCHRVIGSAGTLVGYGGGLEKKKWLLEHEAHAGRASSAPTQLGLPIRTAMP